MEKGGDCNMILKRFRVTNFRSVIDSGWINCDSVTTLVGINESGKSNILLALWKLNPARGGEIDPLHDLPVTKLSDLQCQLETTTFIEAVFKLGESGDVINEELGSEFEPNDELQISRSYDGGYSYKFVNELAAEKLEKLKTSKTSATIDNEEAEEQKYITSEDVFEVVKKYIPHFVYYSNYGNLASKIYLPHAVKWLNGEKVTGVEEKEDQVRTLKVLFDYVNLSPQEILDMGKDAVDIARLNRRDDSPTEEEIGRAEANKEKRAIVLQSAASKLTKEFKAWWKQGEYVFRFGADGDYFNIWVSDDKRPEEVDLELRSTGLQWFLSFYLVFLMESQEGNDNSVLLLDEAGLTLHPLAQKDLALFFNKLAENNQILNTTHSPFIVDPENIDRCRVVFSDENGGTKVSENLREGSAAAGKQSIYAVHAALGLTVSDVLLQGSSTIIVEGISDQYYLTTIKNVLIREKKIAPQKEILFIPSGGVRGVAGIAALVSSKADSLPIVVIDSDKAGNDYRKKLEDGLYKDSKDRILSVADYSGIEQSEIEDMIPFEFILKAVDRILPIQDEEDDEFEPKEGEPIVPQIEKYANERGIELKRGWKVDLAKSFKKMMSGKKKKSISERYKEMWVKLFQQFEE